MADYTFTAKVWLYSGAAAWHLISLPAKEAKALQQMQASKQRRGWGAIKVKAVIGATTWETSIFPDSKRGTYLLPLKAKVRQKEGIAEGSRVALTLKTIGFFNSPFNF